MPKLSNETIAALNIRESALRLAQAFMPTEDHSVDAANVQKYLTAAEQIEAWLYVSTENPVLTGNAGGQETVTVEPPAKTVAA